MPPLTEITKEELEMIKRLAKHFAWKHCSEFDYMFEDVYLDIQERLYKAYTKYDPSKGALLNSWLWNKAFGASLDVRRKLISEIKDIKRREYDKETVAHGRHKSISLDNISEETDTHGAFQLEDKTLPDIDFHIDFENFLDSLSDKYRYIVYLRLEGYTGVEIGRLLDITESRVSQICEKIYDRYLRFSSEQLCS
jgi:RNA polymerase sigma factor (sigma-70 family)